MRTQFTKPVNLNGAQLVSELATGGVVVTGYPTIDGDSNFWLDVTPADKSKAQTVVAAYAAIPNWVSVEEAAFQKDRADGLAKLEALGLLPNQARAVAKDK